MPRSHAYAVYVRQKWNGNSLDFIALVTQRLQCSATSRWPYICYRLDVLPSTCFFRGVKETAH